jgi:hypothetical protein
MLLLLLNVNLCTAKDTSLVIYQRNSFCKLILYSTDQQANKNKFIVEAIEDVTPLYSINTLGRIGGLAWPQDAAIFSTEGVLKLHEQYFNNMKDNLKDNQNIIHLNSIVVSIVGYNTNKDNTDTFQEKLIEKLAENNFTVNTNNITFIDDEDFIKQSGLEALKESCLDKKSYNRILISLQTDHTTNYRLFNSNQKEIGKSFIANKKLTGGYTQLGTETQKFFANIPENYLDYDKDNKVLDKILSSQLNTDLFDKQGDNLAHWLQNGRDSVRGLAIMKYLLVNDSENKPVDDSKDNTVNQQTEDLNSFLDNSLIKILDTCISDSINTINSLTDCNDYAIVFGEFLNNKYIRAKYITELNAKFNEQKRRRVLVLDNKEFHHALIKAAEKIKKINVADNEDNSMFFHFALYTPKPEVNKTDSCSKLKNRHINDFTKNLMKQPLLDILPLLYREKCCPYILENPLFKICNPECYRLECCHHSQ